MNNITREQIVWAAIASQQYRPRRQMALPVREDLTNKDFERRGKRYKVMGYCTEKGKGHLWICRPTSAHGTSEDLHLGREEIEAFVSARLAICHIYENTHNGQVSVR